MLQALMDKLSKDLEIDPPLTPTESGDYLFPLEEDLTIRISERDDLIYFFCPIASYPKENLESFLTRVMLGNLLGQGTEGTILGSDVDGNTLVMSLDIEKRSEYEYFRDKLESFMNAAEFWRLETANHK